MQSKHASAPVPRRTLPALQGTRRDPRLGVAEPPGAARAMQRFQHSSLRPRGRTQLRACTLTLYRVQALPQEDTGSSWSFLPTSNQAARRS